MHERHLLSQGKERHTVESTPFTTKYYEVYGRKFVTGVLASNGQGIIQGVPKSDRVSNRNNSANISSDTFAKLEHAVT